MRVDGCMCVVGWRGSYRNIEAIIVHVSQGEVKIFSFSIKTTKDSSFPGLSRGNAALAEHTHTFGSNVKFTEW